MLLSATHLLDFDVEAIDGAIGDIADFYFDIDSWLIRYLVIDTGKIFPGKKVLLSPNVFGQCQSSRKIMPVNLTRDKVKQSPDETTDLPVSKLHEIELHKYYNWAPYWDSDFIAYPTPGIAQPLPDEEEKKEFEEKIKNNKLRSIREVCGYRLKAKDGQIGHIEDFIIEEKDWSVRYVVADTRNFLSGRKVLLSLQWIGDFDWAAGTVDVDLNVDEIKNSPEFDPSEPINREYEIQLFDYYGRSKSQQ